MTTSQAILSEVEAQNEPCPALRERADSNVGATEAVYQTTARSNPTVRRLLAKPRVNELKDVV